MIKLMKEWSKFINAPIIDNDLKDKGTTLNVVALLLTIFLFGTPYLLIFGTIFSIFSTILPPIHIVIWLIPFYGNFCVMMFTKFLFDMYQVKFVKYEFTQGVSKKRILLGGLCCIYTFIAFIILAVILEILF